MKRNLMISLFFGILTLSSNTLAAIGCLPGDCCNGRPCGNPEPPPNPRVPPNCPPQLGRGGVRQNSLLLRTLENEINCTMQIEQDCSQCSSDASSCEIIYSAGLMLNSICKYCD